MSILDQFPHCPKCYIAMVFEFKLTWKLKHIVRWYCLDCGYFEDNPRSDWFY